LPEPDDAGTDGPLRTLAAAQAAVRRLKAQLDGREEVRVCLRGGRYELSEPLRFTREDAGFGRDNTTWPRQARTWPVTWCAYGDERPVVSGGRRIEGSWQETEVNGRTAWAVPVPDVPPFSQLWVDGRRRFRSRLPKTGLYQVARAVNPDFSKHGHNDSATSFGFQPGELNAAWRNLQDVELHFFGWWLDRRVKIRAIDEKQHLADLDRDTQLRLEWSPGDGIDYVVENVFEALTEPGEWYVDRAEETLYYIPFPDEDMATAEVIVPCLERLLELDGAANLRFEGLTFAHSEWPLPDDLSGSMQAAVHVPAALQIRGAEDVTFTQCHIEHVGTYGAEVLDGSVETAFDHCVFRDLGAGGVKIWHGCRRNAVLDCDIGDGGHLFACAVGVLIGKASGNRVVHCHIHDFYYTGISVGWNWGYAESDGYGNIIEWNHIHDIGKGLLSDMGGIYLLGHAPGTRLRFNHIHDIACRRYGGWCIYTDEGSSHVLIESNLCYRANRTAFNQHYGRENEVRNNILAYGGDAVVSYGRPEAHLGLVFERNILLSHDVPILRNATPDRWTPLQTAFRGNLYWCETGPVLFERGGVAQYGSQPFPDGYLAEAGRYAPLGLPDDEGGDWSLTIEEFWSRSGGTRAPEGAATLRFSRDGNVLVVEGRFRRPAKSEPIEGPVWNREHVELFLKPFPHREGLVQLGLASDGEASIAWHACEAPADVDWEAEAASDGGQWCARLRIPLDAVCRAAWDGGSPDWRFLAGFAVPAELGDFASWQAQGHDPGGVEADPCFADAAKGDFTLSDESPALALGFVPFDLKTCGPRPADGGAQEEHA
jgi:hypothetical protein